MHSLQLPRVQSTPFPSRLPVRCTTLCHVIMILQRYQFTREVELTEVRSIRILLAHTCLQPLYRHVEVLRSRGSKSQHQNPEAEVLKRNESQYFDKTNSVSNAVEHQPSLNMPIVAIKGVCGFSKRERGDYIPDNMMHPPYCIGGFTTCLSEFCNQLDDLICYHAFLCIKRPLWERMGNDATNSSMILICRCSLTHVKCWNQSCSMTSELTRFFSPLGAVAPM